MAIPQVLQQRITQRKDISDGESVSDSEAQGAASATESASEAGLSRQNAIDVEEDTSDEEVGINSRLFDDLSDSSSNTPLLPHLSPTTHQAYPSVL